MSVINHICSKLTLTTKVKRCDNMLTVSIFKSYWFKVTIVLLRLNNRKLYSEGLDKKYIEWGYKNLWNLFRKKEENFHIHSVSPDDTAFFSMNLSVDLSCCCIFLYLLLTFMVVNRRDYDNQFSGKLYLQSRPKITKEHVWMLAPNIKHNYRRRK